MWYFSTQVHNPETNCTIWPKIKLEVHLEQNFRPFLLLSINAGFRSNLMEILSLSRYLKLLSNPNYRCYALDSNAYLF